MLGVIAAGTEFTEVVKDICCWTSVLIRAKNSCTDRSRTACCGGKLWYEPELGELVVVVAAVGSVTVLVLKTGGGTVIG